MWQRQHFCKAVARLFWNSELCLLLNPLRSSSLDFSSVPAVVMYEHETGASARTVIAS